MAAQPGSAAQGPDDPMVATPTRRPGTSGLPQSPKAKRSKRPLEVTPPEASAPQAAQREYTSAEATTAISELQAKMERQIFITANHAEGIDDHAQRLDIAWGMLLRSDSA